MPPSEKPRAISKRTALAPTSIAAISVSFPVVFDLAMLGEIIPRTGSTAPTSSTTVPRLRAGVLIERLNFGGTQRPAVDAELVEFAVEIRVCAELRLSEIGVVDRAEIVWPKGQPGVARYRGTVNIEAALPGAKHHCHMLPDTHNKGTGAQHLLSAIPVLGDVKGQTRRAVLGHEIHVVCAGRCVVRQARVDADVEHALPVLRGRDVDPGRYGHVPQIRKRCRRHGKVARASLGQRQRLAHLARRERVAGRTRS